MTDHTNLITPRDWQIQAQAEAADGYAARMAEARRYGAMAVALEAAQSRIDFKEMVIERNAELARLAEIEADASPVEPSESAEHWHSLYIKKCQELHDEKARLGAEIETLELAAIDDAERYAVPSSQAQPPAPSDTAITYMTGYSDGREWAGATSQAQQAQSVPEPVLQWCDKCGEGTVQGLCRGKLDDCKFKQAQPEAGVQSILDEMAEDEQLLMDRDMGDS